MVQPTPLKTLKISSSDRLDLFEVEPNRFISVAMLKEWLPTVEVALFFAMTYRLDWCRLGALLRVLFDSPVIQALTDGDHSVELQDYLVEVVPEDIQMNIAMSSDAPPPAEVLPQLWEAALVEVASSIQEVADKLKGTLELLPSKQGAMVFSAMAVMNSKRPTIGDFKARVAHPPVPDVLVILDVSGSMTEETIRAIVGDVVSLSWTANAYLAIVSDSAFCWTPGSYSVDDVLARAEYWGTHYEQLAPLFDRDWGVVVTIADYDSSNSAKSVLSTCPGRVEKVLDISLVGRPTFLAECVGQLAKEVRPLMVARNIISNSWY